ncbi:DNA topoisomerase IB [Lacinutrix chionoecetis]
MAKSNFKNDKFLKELWSAPEIAIEKLDLIYATNRILKIKRRRKKEHFIYEYNGEPLKDKKDLKRIDGLVIPPAWDDVNISSLENTHLQATGRDAKARKQYRYHPVWNKIRNQTKFYRMLSFGKVLPGIRKQIDKDLNQTNWPKTKTLALVLKLMEETHIRIGNEQYAKRNKTYGLSTLRSKHVHVAKDKIKFEFTGKKGKAHSVSVRNKRLRHLINKCQELPGWELFKYYDANGVKHTIDSSMVNDYIYTICNSHFTAKDFRTWAASVVFLDSLFLSGLTSDKKDKEKNILLAYDAAAKALGNTRNVCRKYYVHPIIAEQYTNNAIKKAFNVMASKKQINNNFSKTEEALLMMLAQFIPDFLVKS